MIYHKAFGHHTYDSLAPVLTSDVYDLASITKIAATTLTIMRLYEEGRISWMMALANICHGSKHPTYRTSA